MAQIPALITFTANTTLKSADMNSNFAAITTAFNGSAMLTDTPATVAVTHIFTVSQTFKAGVAVSGGATFTSGVTFSSGTTITASGVSVSGAMTFSSSISFTAPMSCTASVNMTGPLTVTGAAIFSTSVTSNTITVAGGTLAVSGLSATCGGATFVAGAVNSGIAIFTLPALAGNAMKAQSDGSVIIGTTVATSATLGYVYIPTATATSTGTPATQSGMAAIAFETGNSHLQIWNPVAGAWKTVALT